MISILGRYPKVISIGGGLGRVWRSPVTAGDSDRGQVDMLGTAGTPGPAMANAREATARPEIGGKRPVSWQNLAIGAAIQVFEVSTLGQPFEVLKTHMAGRARTRAGHQS